MTLKNLIFTLLLLGMVQDTWAQRYSISRYTSKNGLAQNECKVLMKDFRGNIWVGTEQGGLSRYDGQKFVNYSTREGLADNFIYAIAQDTLHNVWVATGNGISKYNGDRFTNFLTSETDRVLISALTIDSQNQIWFFQKGKGIGKITPKGNIEYVFNAELSNAIDNALFADSQNRIWVATENQGVFVYQEDSWKHYSVAEGLNTPQALSFLETTAQEIWVGTTLGVSLFNGERFTSKEELATLNPLPIRGMDEDMEGGLWFATSQGAWRYKNQKITPVSTANGLTQDVDAVKCDNDGGVFFASSEGLYRWNNDVFSIFKSEHGLLGERIFSCAIAPNNAVWVSSENGINIIENGEISTPANIPFLLTEQKTPIVADSAGTIYFGSMASIYVYDGETFEPVFREDELSENEHFTCGLVTSKQDVFFGGNNGVCQYKEGKLTTYLPTRLLKGFTVSVLYEDKNGDLLVGTDGGGIFRYRKGSLQQFRKRKGFPNGVINSMIYDQRGNLWLGTTGNGIMKVPDGDLTSSVVTFDDLALTSSNVYSLLADNAGNLWAGTDRGLSKIKVLQNDYVKVVNYQEQEGFLPLEVYPNAVCKDLDGHLWFGTIEGAVEVNPEKEAFTNSPPNVYFEGLNLFFETVPWTDYTDSVNLWSGMPVDLALPNHKNHLQFSFVGVSMNIPEEVTYQWQLEGVDQNWTPPSTQSEAIYTNIPPGDYVFKVKACNSGGVCNDDYAVFTFQITKPFYQTRAFIVILLMLLGGLLYLFFKMRLRQLERDQYTLQQKVSERTQEIEMQKAEIEKQSDRIEKALHEIEHKNDALKKANEETTNSLEYAGRIQNAVLSYKARFKELFPESFILNISRKIVTGDFIWLKQRGDYTYVAMVDCTGSGVPAAFMSIIGYDFLNQVIEDCEDGEPATILTEVNQKVISALHMDDTNTELNDGMDIAMLSINRKKNEMIFTGARRSIILITPQNELKTIKGEFFSVGINYSGVEATFKQHTIPLEKGTIIYLFSDGFRNQFDEQGKKYKTSNFRKLLNEVNQYDMSMQKSLLKDEFYRWKGNAEQLDDVFIAGFKP